MPADVLEKPAKVPTADKEVAQFGAYGRSSSATKAAQHAVGKNASTPPLEFLDNNKLWLTEVGATTATPDDYKKAWRTTLEKHHDKHLRWNETYSGRLAIRAVSRGVIGAIFYAAGQMYSVDRMKNYTPDGTVKAVTNEAGEVISEGLVRHQNMLQKVTAVIDKTLGRSIEWTVTTLTGDKEKGKEAVTFRHSIDYGYRKKLGGERMGRSLGHEAMMVTFDFAAMSFGDYMTRYFVGLMDPNAQTKWIKDGHIDVPGGLKETFKQVFRGITYAAGEDIAVAVPYVYYMKAQRNLIDRQSPGFRYDADRSMYGASLKVNEHGKVTGDYQLEGMLDLMGRFTVYNIGTKMFRDAYNYVDAKVNSWRSTEQSHQLASPELKKNLNTSLLDNLKMAPRYLIRTAAKVAMYMIPSSAVFAAIRSSQGNTRGIAIHPEYGVMGRQMKRVWGYGEEDREMVYGNQGILSRSDHEMTFRTVKPDSKITQENEIASIEGVAQKHRLHFMSRTNAGSVAQPQNPFTEERTDAFTNAYYEKAGIKAPWYRSVVNPLSKASYNAGGWLSDKLKPFSRLFVGDLNRYTNDRDRGIALRKAEEKVQRFARITTNASLAYGPYFGLKTDVFSAAWDSERMDMALDRVLDGLTKFSWGEFRAGIGEVMRSTLQQPFADPAREAQAKHATLHDAERISNEAFQVGGWVRSTGKNQDQPVAKRLTHAFSTPHPTSQTYTQLLLQSPPATSWAAQETQRKLHELSSAGHTIH